MISGNDIEHLIDGLFFTDRIIVVTDRTSIELTSGEVKVKKKGEENDARNSFGYRLNDNLKSPLACKVYRFFLLL